MIGQKLGRFRITARLGQGGIATVWKAHDELLGRVVALKILAPHVAQSPRSRQRFINEARATSRLDHPGIISVLDAGECAGMTYIALSLVDGQTVSELAARRLVPVDEALRIAGAAADALGHAHTRGVIHRDVTGRNIMLAGDGRIIVLDFGLALAAGMTRLTTSETAMGTTAYMAPEVASGGAGDERSDLYGLGVVLFEMLTGRFPFCGDRPEAMIYAAINEPPAIPSAIRPGLPAALDRLVLKAIARDPAGRYQSAREMCMDLTALTRELIGPPTLEARGAASPELSPATMGRVTTTTAGGHTRPPRPEPLYLAILPFSASMLEGSSMSNLTELAGRLPETLGAALARGSDVRVIPVDVSEAVAAANMAALAVKLGANTVLRGCVIGHGTQVRITWSAADPHTGVQWAGDVVDGPALLPFDLEDHVLSSVRRGLGLPLAPLVEKVGRRPPDPAAADRLTQALRNLERHDREAAVDSAISILEELVASEGESATLCAALTRAYHHKHVMSRESHWETRAAAACERAVLAAPQAPGVLLALGDLHLGAGRIDEARREYGRVLEAQPDSIEALVGLSRSLAASGDFAKAEEVCRRAIAIRPRDWRGHYRLGHAFYDQSRYAEAIEPLRRVVELTPDNLIGWRMLAGALFHLDRFDEAENAFSEALAIQPSALACTNLGALFFYQGKYEEAIAAFMRATALAPADARIWGNLGSALRWAPGDEKRAQAPLERAIALMQEQIERNPADGMNWARLAGWFSNCGRHAEALPAIRRALELAPADMEILSMAGDVYFNAGERSLALRCLEEAVRGGYGVGVMRRSRSLSQLQNDPEFLRILEEAEARAGSR